MDIYDLPSFGHSDSIAAYIFRLAVERTAASFALDVHRDEAEAYGALGTLLIIDRDLIDVVETRSIALQLLDTFGEDSSRCCTEYLERLEWYLGGDFRVDGLGLIELLHEAHRRTSYINSFVASILSARKVLNGDATLMPSEQHPFTGPIDG